jgi:hypothetical protein
VALIEQVSMILYNSPARQSIACWAGRRIHAEGSTLDLYGATADAQAEPVSSGAENHSIREPTRL